MSVLFRVSCPTPDAQTALALREARPFDLRRMKADALTLGCRFHRAGRARDGHAFYAVAIRDSRDRAREFSCNSSIPDAPGEEAVSVEGDIGLATEG